MSDLTPEQENVINKVKDRLYRSLSYTGQSYDVIIREMIDVFRGTSTVDGITTSWDNISEADIMFIFMSILAAHKDILNYMVDYRILETYMSTARERQSVSRIAHSFGYKIPSYKAARALVTIDSINADPTPSNLIINKFDTFVDDAGVSWVYLGEDRSDLGVGSTIELFQGVLNTVTLLPGNFVDNAHNIGNSTIAIGNNYSNIGCSSLVLNAEPAIEFTEVNNLYKYFGIDQEIYELNVDPSNVVYLRLSKEFNLVAYSGNTFTFRYLVTRAETIKSIKPIERLMDDNVTLETYTVNFVGSDFTAGSKPMSVDDIRYNFKRHYATRDSLVTLEDYKNYILREQKDIIGITRCLVIDAQDDTEMHVGDSGLPLLETDVFVLKDNSVQLSAEERATLKASLEGLSIGGTVVYVDTTSTTNNLTETPIYIKILTAEILSEVQTILTNYINNRPIGSTITAEGIHEELFNYGYNYYDKISLGESVISYGDSVILDYFAYAALASIATS